MANLERKDTSNSFTRQGRIDKARIILIEAHMSDLQAFGKEAFSPEDLAYLLQNLYECQGIGYLYPLKPLKRGLWTDNAL